jgi:transcriptional regulator with XRE-family HTH domain
VTVVAQQQDGGMTRLATQLNHLFATVPRPGGRDLWTNEDAAAAMTDTGVAMSAAYLSQLRTGKRDNPSARHLAAIARLFEVPMEYFFDPEVAAKIDADLRLLVAVRDAGVHTIALRAQGLSEESLSGVAGMIEHIRRLERIPDQPPDTE